MSGGGVRTRAALRHRVWRRLAPPRPGTALVGAAHGQAAAGAWAVIRALYAYNFLVALQLVRDLPRWQAGPTLDPLWPVAWIGAVGVAAGATGLLLAHLATSLAALLLGEHRLCRLACALTALPAFALQSSLGKVNHGYHGLLWVLILWVLLPGRDQPLRRVRQRTLRIFWAGQAAVLLFYSMSGALKWYAALSQLARGEVGFLSPEGGARHVAHRLLQTQGDSLLGPWLIDHAWLAGPTQWLTLYLETAALLVAFRPASHRLWGIGLIAMHTGIGLCMGIWFTHQIAVVALLLVCSPFLREQHRVADALASLPLIGDLWARLRRARRGVISRSRWESRSEAAQEGRRGQEPANAGQKRRKPRRANPWGFL